MIDGAAGPEIDAQGCGSPKLFPKASTTARGLHSTLHHDCVLELHNRWERQSSAIYVTLLKILRRKDPITCRLFCAIPFILSSIRLFFCLSASVVRIQQTQFQAFGYTKAAKAVAAQASHLPARNRNHSQQSLVVNTCWYDEHSSRTLSLDDVASDRTGEMIAGVTCGLRYSS